MTQIETGFSEGVALLKALWRRKFVAAAAAGLMLAGCLAVIMNLTPVYEASALVQVSPVAELRAAEDPGMLDRPSDPVLIRSEVDILISDELSRRVIERLGLASMPEFRKEPADARPLAPAAPALVEATAGPLGLTPEQSAEQDRLVRIYNGHLSVFNDSRTTIARITYASEDPVLASAVANAHAELYYQSRVERGLEASNLQSSRIISPALTPSEPSSPKKRLLFVVSLAASLGFGALTALVLDWLRPGPYSLRDLAARLRLRPLVSLPLEGQSHRRLTPAMRKALFDERIRSLCSLLPDQSPAGGVVVVVASCLPDEGKDLVATATARALNARGLPALLIDADPNGSAAVPSASAAAPAYGLEHLLSGQARLQDVTTVVGGAYVVSLRGPDRKGAALLAGPRLQAALDEARQSFDVVLINAPPIAITSDAAALSRYCDAVLLVVRSERTPQRLIEQMLARLEAQSAPLLGLVLTGEDRDDADLLSRRVLEKYLQPERRPAPPDSAGAPERHPDASREEKPRASGSVASIPAGRWSGGPSVLASGPKRAGPSA